MKLLNKRSLAWVASLMMLISVFASVVVLPTEAATVDYVTSGKYVYNWGAREEVATFLSPMAEDWYEENNTTYEELSSLSGGNGTSGVTSSALYRELQDLMVSNHDTITSYDATKNLFKYTDCQNGGGKISSFYSGKEIGPSWDGAWNREHTWPNSKGEGNGENDIMMLRPTSTSENSGRGNTAYGQSSGYYNPNSESNGEYDLRGDVARIMLYQHVRWSQSKLWGSSGVMESLSVLLAWVEDDPVDTWELGRNDAVEAITGTRNVFVDYPELIFVLFGEEIPTDYQTPSGKAAEGAYTITATSNNTAYGTVLVSGKVINATPKTGYEVVGYDILSGSAAVTQNGNAFTVDADADVSIRINFAPRYQTVVGFLHGDGMAETLFPFVGDEITMPTYDYEVKEGWSFVGWVESEMEETTTVPTFYPAGSKYMVADEEGATFYALFSRTEQDGGNSSNVFLPYSGELTEGDYLIVYGGKAMIGAVTDKTRLDVVDVTMQGSAVLMSNESAVWHIAPDGDNWTLYNSAAGKYAAGTTIKSSNQATLNASATDYAKWTLTVKTTGYEFTNVGRAALGYNPLLRYNKSVDSFACYATNTTAGGPNLLYKRASGTTYYFTDNSCWHQYEMVSGSYPLCGSEGSLVGYECILCGEYYEEWIEAEPEHMYFSETPLCGSGEVLVTVTCAICEHSYEKMVTTAPAHEFEIYSEDEPICGGDDCIVYYECIHCTYDYEEIIEVPSEHTYDDAYDADCNVCGTVRDVPEKPTHIPGDINGDGSVNNRDLVRLQQHLAEWDVAVVAEALDVTGDGNINNRDLVRQQQYLAEWDVEIF